MDGAVEAMSSEYEEFVVAAVEVVESSGDRPGRALEELKQRWQLFMAACDEAEEVVELARRRITAEHVMDVASGMAPSATSLPPISVPRLQRAVQAINSLAVDLRQGCSPPAAHNKVD